MTRTLKLLEYCTRTVLVHLYLQYMYSIVCARTSEGIREAGLQSESLERFVDGHCGRFLLDLLLPGLEQVFEKLDLCVHDTRTNDALAVEERLL